MARIYATGNRRTPSLPIIPSLLREIGEDEAPNEVEIFLLGLSIQDEREFLSLALRQMMARRGRRSRLALVRHIAGICAGLLNETRHDRH